MARPAWHIDTLERQHPRRRRDIVAWCLTDAVSVLLDTRKEMTTSGTILDHRTRRGAVPGAFCPERADALPELRLCMDAVVTAEHKVLFVEFNRADDYLDTFAVDLSKVVPDGLLKLLEERDT